MPTGPQIILTLKVLVVTVTILYALSMVALARKNIRLHGRINTWFFILTMLTVLVFEVLVRLGMNTTAQFSEEARQALRVHLMFSIPAAVILPVQFLFGRRGIKRLHVPLGVIFTILWIGTFITGVFFLPHE